jgi:hypothetical protein
VYEVTTDEQSQPQIEALPSDALAPFAEARFADRVVGVRDGEFRTKPEPILEGAAIAEGVDSQLGTTPVDHLAFIVTTIRDHLWARECDHVGALLFCPKCGRRS